MSISTSSPAISRKVLNGSARAARLHGLDGLRAIAVGAVLLYHVETLGWAAGGYLGVDLFFAISGFLITGLLADQRERDYGFVGLPAVLLSFYWRRTKRLLPAMWLMLAAVPLAAAWLAADALPGLRDYTPSALLYVTNWELIGRQTSYFEAMGRQPLLLHLWSLAIEGQFYLAWGLLALALLPRLGRARLALVTLALAAASVAWMAWLAASMGYQPGQADPSRLYFGTDTRGFQLLLGAALGLLWRPASAGAKSAARVWPVGLAALAAMLALLVLLDEQTAWLYPWGLLAAGGASAALIWAATHPGAAFGLWLDNRPMRWIGERSYGIYLWHWPIFMLMRPGIDLPMLPPAVVVVGNIALSVVAAALSYKYVEAPIHHGWLERLYKQWRTPWQPRMAWQPRAALLTSVAVACCAVAVLWQAPDQAAPAADVQAAMCGAAPAPEETAAPADAPAPQEDAQADSPAPTALAAPASPPAHAAKPEPAKTAAADLPGGELTAVGDSVLLGSSRLLADTLEGADVHATVGWQAFQMFNQLKQLSASGQLRPVVLVQIGNNGYLAESQLRQILALLSGARRVIVANTHVPRRWMSANNTLIDRVAADYPNVAVANWRDVSDGHGNYFVSDGVHLTAAGQRAFIAEIVRAGKLTPAPVKVAGAARQGAPVRRAAPPPAIEPPQGIPPVDDLLAANL